MNLHLDTRLGLPNNSFGESTKESLHGVLAEWLATGYFGVLISTGLQFKPEPERRIVLF